MVSEKEFIKIYNTHRQQVSRICMGYFKGNESIAKEVVQDVFIKVWEKLADFRGDSSIATWIYRITVNTCLMYLRSKKRKVEIQIEALPEVISEELDDSVKNDQLKKLYACIHELEELNRIIILTVLEGLSYEEIAGIVGVSEDTLRVRIHRIKKKLTNCVKK